MNYFSSLGNKFKQLCIEYYHKKHPFLLSSMKTSMFNYIISHAKPFWLHLCYFLVVSLIGVMALKVSKPRTDVDQLTSLDLFYTAVSASTVSSMSAVEMEVFSNYQLVVMTILMLLGGEVFTSMLSLQLRRFKFSSYESTKVDNSKGEESIELGIINQFSSTSNDNNKSYSSFNYNYSIKLLGYVVLGYMISLLTIGSSLVTMYMILTPSANHVLKNKRLILHTFSFFVIVSTFSSCGFVPTNENMMIFRQNPGLLLIIIPYLFLGNSLYPVFLRSVTWVLERFTKRKEFYYMLNNYQEMGYDHLMSSKKTWFLGATTIGFWVLQIAVFSGMEWSSGVMEGMSSYEKFVGTIFQTASSRHSGEYIVDLSIISPVVLVLFIIMMYLPAYTSFLPVSNEHQEEVPESNIITKKQNEKKRIIENMLLSQISYLVIFIMLVCITERKSLKEDPLNFSVLNIVFEIIRGNLAEVVRNSPSDIEIKLQVSAPLQKFK
ncbi:sodium transporter HKT1-like isoform X2 [Chenopodium quinoa]|uniref:sodium transporter HKT1-like isoform X2 n=1 Tax=Chenopodium quinoa TaxID=63459 RepID=UPI000B76D2CF|nr:sodium transporter HKT1-like isoform X2 [Chenopodium quinoa]